MISILNWCGRILAAALNGIARFVVQIVILLVVIFVITLAFGDGLSSNMVLALDLRDSMADSSGGEGSVFVPQPVTVMNLVLALDAARRDTRVKGVTVRLGDGAISLAQAEEIAPALAALRKAGKFVLVHASGFNGAGLGDYVAASAADAIWMPPKGHFAPSGTAIGEIFLRGLFDKVQAVPQMAKRAEYKSAADMYMEKGMTAPDREQLTRIAQSTYDSGVAAIAAARHLDAAAVRASLDTSPQLTEDALAAHLIDHVGYDDDVVAEALRRAGAGAKSVEMKDYIRSRNSDYSAPIALIEASGEIRDGKADNSLFGSVSGIASDDLSEAIDQATKDKAIKAIVLRVDSPGGSVSASDQILHAVKKAQAAGKKVVVSMGSVAASGGYYISLSADKIVAQPATLTGSIGVLTGKVSVDKSLALAGVSAENVSVGKNTLMDSPLQPYTDEQWAAVNREVDTIYADFTQKVAAGRKLPLAQVQDVARGRVWTGADAKTKGLVDELGGFWTAAATAARLAGVDPANTHFKIYPRNGRLLGSLRGMVSGADAAVQTLGQVRVLLGLPGVREVVHSAASLPQGGVEMRDPSLSTGLRP
jgi:protease-4